MKSRNSTDKIFVGVDVSKATLDVYRPDTQELWEIENSDDHEQKHGALVARRSQLLELINQESNRLKQAWNDDAKQSLIPFRQALLVTTKERCIIRPRTGTSLNTRAMPQKIQHPCPKLTSRKELQKDFLNQLLTKLETVADPGAILFTMNTEHKA